MAFDLKTHHRDPKTGQITRKTPYQLRVEGGQMRYMRNGVAYHPDGSKFDPNAMEVVPKGPEELKLDLQAELQKAKDLISKADAERVFLAKERSELAAMKAQLDQLKNQKPPVAEVKGIK